MINVSATLFAVAAAASPLPFYVHVQCDCEYIAEMRDENRMLWSAGRGAFHPSSPPPLILARVVPVLAPLRLSTSSSGEPGTRDFPIAITRYAYDVYKWLFGVSCHAFVRIKT